MPQAQPRPNLPVAFRKSTDRIPVTNGLTSNCLQEKGDFDRARLEALWSFLPERKGKGPQCSVDVLRSPNFHRPEAHQHPLPAASCMPRRKGEPQQGARAAHGERQLRRQLPKGSPRANAMFSPCRGAASSVSILWSRSQMATSGSTIKVVFTLRTRSSSRA